MKNFNKTILVLCLVFIISSAHKCKDNPTPSSSTNTTTGSTSKWYVGGPSYTSSSAARTTVGGNNALGLADGTNNSGIVIYFPSFPTANGTYNVVKYNTSGVISANLTSNQISVDATINNGSDDYLSSGSGNTTATVTVNSGKITVTLPALWGNHYTSSGQQADSLKITGTVIEK